METGGIKHRGKSVNTKLDNIQKRNYYEESKKHAVERTKRALEKGTKVCTVCGIEKPVSDFYKRGNGGFYSRCKSCERAAQKLFRDSNPEHMKHLRHESNVRCKAHIDAYNHEYSRAHSAENVARACKWAKENPEKAKELGVRRYHRRRARLENLPYGFSKADWEQCKAFFTDSDGTHCAYCGRVMKRLTQDHVVPAYSNGGYTKDNIIPACHSCNCRKSRAEVWEWYRAQPFYSEEREQKIREYLSSM